MNTQFLTLTFLLFAFKMAIAQDLPTVIHPSPRAASFHIYGDVPVSHSTGVPDITIPLYTIESDGITVPIVLSYHTSSIKPGNDNSNMAFGWTLNVGGRISRTVNSWPDEYVPRPATFELTGNLDPEDDNDFTYLYQASGQNGPYLDTEYDIFSYSALGDHSKFIINNQTGSQPTIHELMESPKIINFSTVTITDFHPTIASIDYFKSVNGIGQTFYFGENNNYEVVNGDCSVWGRTPTSWLLTKIVSADKSNTINFTYDSVPQEIQTSNAWADKQGLTAQDQMTYIGGHQGGYISNPPSDSCSNDDLFDCGISYEIKTIQEISFNDGKVVFNLSSDKKRINSIEVRDPDNVLIKSIDFVKSYFYDQNFPNQTEYESLDRLEINDHNDTPVKVYEFEYFDNGMPLEYETDFWGYYNNQDNYAYKREIINVENNHNFNAQFTCQSGSSHKNASETYCKSYTLNKIIYPTGGSTEFDYELNQFTGSWSGSQGVQTINGGGLRVKSITKKPNDGSSDIIKTYVYTPRHFGWGSAKNPLDPYNYTTTSYFVDEHPLLLGYGFYVRYRSRSFSHGFNGNLQDNSINYEEVTEYQGGSLSNSNTGKTVYIYQYGLENKYWNKSEADPALYDFGTTDLINQSDLGRNKLIEYRDGQNGKLKETEYFKNINGLYTSIKKITNTYLFHQTINTFYNLNVVNVCSYKNLYGASDDFQDQFDARKFSSYGLPVGSFPPSPVLPVLSSYDSYIYQSSANLIKQEVTEKPDSGTEITTTTEYTYNDNGLVTEQIVHDSKGNTQIAKTIYPDDIKTVSTLEDNSSLVGGSLTSTAFNAISDMKGSLNQTAIPIQTETYKDDGTTETLLSIQRTNFSEPYTDIILPDNIQTSKGTGALEDRIQFQDYYSNGNIKEVLKTDGTPIVYIWGYNETYPIAKVENATYSEVSSQVSNLHIKSDADDDRTIGTSGNEGALRSALTTLRTLSALSDAMVTTYTYDPLIGITSVTDPKGYTMYYEYDDFNRLKQVKDADGKILSQNEYHYKGQQ